MGSSFILSDECGHNQASYNCKISDIINDLNDGRRWVRPIGGKISAQTSLFFIFLSKFACKCKKNGKIYKPCRRNLVLTDSLAFAIDFWMLPRYIPEHFGIFPKFNDGKR